MEFNHFIFASPSSTYTIDDLPNLLLIPKQSPSHIPLTPQTTTLTDYSHRRIRSHEIRLDDINNSQSSTYISYYPKLKEKKPNNIVNKSLKHDQIPCLYYRYCLGSNKLILYFHANAEDLGMISIIISQLSQYLKVNVLAVEYPGYGIYKGNPTSSLLYEDADIIYNYIEERLNYKPKDVFVMGRSIGSGPACYIAANKPIGGLILVSAFKSIKAVVKSAFGKLAAFFIAERFKNIELIKKIECPILFIHGKKDKMIPIEHCLDMAEVCKALGKKHEIQINEEMGHNNVSTLQDVCMPFVKFIKKFNIEIKNDVKYIKPLPEEIAWKYNGIAEKRKNSLMKMLMEKTLKGV